MDAVTITEPPLTIGELVRVASGARVELAPPARLRIRASREVVEAALAAGKPVYGLNTGLGHMKDVRLPEDALRSFQETMLAAHAGGIGPALPTSIVRGALVVRLNGIALGGSGASPAAADVLAAMLNAGVHPVVPGIGSVGAGDLPQMACIAMVAIGRGRAEYMGELLPGAEALRLAGITPLVLEPKDGLTLMSANGVAIAHAALVVTRAEEVAQVADVAAALSLEACRANPSVTHQVVAFAKPFPGQIEACRHLRALLEGSDLLGEGAPRSIQDPLSFRVVPQVHGALREFVAFARRAVEIELNSLSDNPLVSVTEQAMIHNGNFHPMVMALAFDALRPALAQVGQISERRMSHLWDAFLENPLTFAGQASSDAVRGFSGLSLRWPAAAVLAELKQLASPATLDCPPLESGGIEDHATSAPLSVQKTERALDLLQDVLAIELLLARDVLSVVEPRPTLGAGTAAALLTVEEAVAATDDDGSPAAVHRDVRSRMPRALLESVRNPGASHD
jgi:histidine ammonia-lyase